MAEDVEILDQVDEQQDPQPGLSEPDRKHLDSIVHQMTINGESDSAIQFVVDDFKKKYSGGGPKASGLAQAVGTKVPQDLMATWNQSPKPTKVIVGGKQVLPSEAAKEEAESDRIGLAKLGQNAEKAQQNINANLHTNDAAYDKLIRESRANAYSMDQMKKEYQQKGQIIPIGKENDWLQREKKRQYDLPVTPEDISDAKSGVILNEQGTRSFLNRIGDKKLLADAYLVDKHQEAANDPNGHARAPVIAKQAKQIERGKLNYDPETGTLTKPESFYNSLVTSWHQKNKAFSDYERYTDGDKAHTIALLEQDIKNHDPDKPIPVPEGAGGHAGAMIGGNPVSVLLSGGIAAAGVTALGEPELAEPAAKTASALVGAHDFYKMAYGSILPQAYAHFRQQGLNEEEAYDRANHLANSQAAVDAATGAVFGGVGFGSAFNPSGSVTKAFGQSILKGLTQLGETGAKKSLEGLLVGGVGASGQIFKNLMAQHAGLPTDTYEGVGEQFKAGLAFTLGAALLAKSSKLLTGPTKTELRQGLSKASPEQLNETMSNLVQTGQISEEQAKSTLQQVEEHRSVDQLIPENISEGARLKIQEKIKQRNELEEKIKSTDKAFHEPLKEKVKKLNEDIIGLSNEKEEVSDNAKLIEKNLDQIPEVFHLKAKEDPEGFMKFIADQSFGRDENGTVMEGQSAEAEMRKNFGDKLVDKAKEQFPLQNTSIIAGDGQYYANTPRMQKLVQQGNEIRGSLPPVPEGHTRLWRGNRPGETGENPSFTNSLEGIALPFQEQYGGDLSYVDVPNSELGKYENKVGAAPGSEFDLPPELAKQAKTFQSHGIEFNPKTSSQIFSDLEGSQLIRGEKAKQNANERINSRYGEAANKARFINDNFADIEKQLLSSKVIQKICP